MPSIRNTHIPTTPAAGRPHDPAAGALPTNGGASEKTGDVRPTELKIPHNLSQVVSLLKLSDEQLVDQLFPEGAQQPPPEVE